MSHGVTQRGDRSGDVLLGNVKQNGKKEKVWKGRNRVYSLFQLFLFRPLSATLLHHAHDLLYMIKYKKWVPNGR